MTIYIDGKNDKKLRVSKRRSLHFRKYLLEPKFSKSIWQIFDYRKYY
ncbi:MAG: hypothetical protein MGG37_01075 [Trichodesmium sp. MAG_R01]|nr:hypothetical protein [Trichodesmium sp. MAG_R01]